VAFYLGDGAPAVSDFSHSDAVEIDGSKLTISLRRAELTN
jgi:hypothetical protein